MFFGGLKFRELIYLNLAVVVSFALIWKMVKTIRASTIQFLIKTREFTNEIP